MLKIVENKPEVESSKGRNILDELVQEGARRMLQAALEAEVASYIERHQHERGDDGRRLVVRNGHAVARKITCGAGTLEVQAPRVNDKRVDEAGKRQRFTSRILPPYMRRSPRVSEVLPILYLRGLSTGDFKEALPTLLGEDASGLSATSIARFTSVWEDEYQQFRRRSLAGKDYVYVWVDGIHFNVRLEEERLCTLVMIGVLRDGTKELIAVEDGYRESKESWSELLRELKHRGMRAPVVAVGDGALGFWGAVRDVWPQTRGQRCWCHKMVNVLDKLPKRQQPKAKRILRDAMYAATRKDAEDAFKTFAVTFASKNQRAVDCLHKDQEELLTFMDLPSEHWRHLRTTNVIESPFATVRLRQRVTKGAGNRTKALTMAFKLLMMAEKRWRKVDGANHLPLVRAGVTFVDGLMATTDADESQKDAA